MSAWDRTSKSNIFGIFFNRNNIIRDFYADLFPHLNNHGRRILSYFFRKISIPFLFYFEINTKNEYILYEKIKETHSNKKKKKIKEKNSICFPLCI